MLTAIKTIVCLDSFIKYIIKKCKRMTFVLGSKHTSQSLDTHQINVCRAHNFD